MGSQVQMLPDVYGCVVANRFGDLLGQEDGDADPFDFLSQVEIMKEKKKKKGEEEKKKKKKCKQQNTGQKESQKDRRLPLDSDGKSSAPDHKEQQQQRPRPGPGAGAESRRIRGEPQRAAKRAAFGERGTHQVEYPQEFSIPNSSENAAFDVMSRGGNRGRRSRGGFTRNPENLAPRGKREYDRHAGMGNSPEDKRGGRGPWNWGSVKETAIEVMEVTSDGPVKPEEPQLPGDKENQAVQEDGEMVVQVAMEMTLDEWKTLQEVSRPKAEFNIRKAENKIPSKAKVIHQSKCPEKVRGTIEDMEDEGNFLRKSVNDITSLLEINFGSLGRPSRGGRGRGARGGPASRLERAKPILERETNLAPDPDDPEDFPALSAGR
ncbi:intracellular hyaluronan-binding protein 4-like [Brachionichthys hirsutus]|uniref:intracellular hyaluronan-binding protein 4-like n=1 Tax=Brachionichthys hirsutus TaxID=412623 RepID=UPI003604C986